MRASNAMHGEPDHQATLVQAIRALNDAITELGIQAENTFKEAAEALFGQEPAITASVRAARVTVARHHEAVHETALALLAQTNGPGRETRRLVELQQTAVEFRRIAERSAAIAELAQALNGSAEFILHRAGCVDPLILRRIVRQTYLLVRGAVIVCATRDTARARLLVKDMDSLRSSVTDLKSMIEQAIQANPLQAFPLQQLVLVGAEMEHIGARAAIVCGVILIAP
jgi:Na+/phosphate symporter